MKLSCRRSPQTARSSSLGSRRITTERAVGSRGGRSSARALAHQCCSVSVLSPSAPPFRDPHASPFPPRSPLLLTPLSIFVGHTNFVVATSNFDVATSSERRRTLAGRRAHVEFRRAHVARPLRHVAGVTCSPCAETCRRRAATWPRRFSAERRTKIAVTTSIFDVRRIPRRWRLRSVPMSHPETGTMPREQYDDLLEK